MADIFLDEVNQPQAGGMRNIFLDEVEPVSSGGVRNIFLDEEEQAPSAPAAPVSTKEQAIARARQQGEGETGFWGTVGEAALEGLKGGARAAKAVGQGVLGTATGVVRLAGTPVRMATGWDGIHRLADKIDQSYANFGSDALESDYGESPDHWGYSVGRAGEKMAGTAGSLLGIGGPGLIAKAGKLPGAVRATGAAVQKALPFMFGNDAAVRAYDTARGNGRSKGEAAALAGLNGAIHFIGFKLFENKSLNKMLGMPQEMEAMMPKWAGEAAAAAPQTFTSLARSVRNGMIKYTLAERGKGMLKAGGIIGVQNLLSDPVMQVAEGKSLDDIDFLRTLGAGLEGLEEGALMEGLMGGAAIYKSPKAAREFIADKLYRGKDYKVIGSDGKPHNEPGLLETPQGRMFIMKQNPAATERVLDIVDHGGKPTKAELDQAFLPSDMSAEELKKFHDDWYNDLSVEEQRGGDEGILGDHEETEMAQGPSRTDVDLAGVRARAREIREEERDERQAGQRIEQQAEQMQRAAQEQQAAKEEQDAYDQAMAEHEEGRYLAGKPEPAKTTIEIPDEALNQGAAPEEGKTPTQEKPNETGNGTHEAPAQSEEGTARQPEVGEAADAKAPEQARGEAPREGVVEPPAEEKTPAQPPSDHKKRQFETIQKSNPMNDDVHTGIRSESDIKTFDEAVKDEPPSNPDFTEEMAKEALEKGSVVVYSSKPIENGAFVTTSEQMAKDYAGKGKVYSKEVPLTDVAWISGDEGQMASVGRNGEGVKPRGRPAEEGRQNLTPPEGEAKPAETQGPAKPAEPPKTPQEASAEAGQAKETPKAEKPPEAVSEAPKTEPAPEKPAPTNRLKRRDGTDPLAEKKKKAEAFNAPAFEIGEDGKKKPIGPAAEKPAEPVAEEPAQESPALETAKPVEEKKSNRLRRADGTDPLAEKEEQAKGKGRPRKTDVQKLETVVARYAKKAKAIYDRIVGNYPEGELDSLAFRKQKGNGGLKLGELRTLVELADDGWHKDLGLPEKEADRLLDAVKRAYEEQRVGTPGSQDGKVNEAGTFNYSVKASNALTELKKKPKSIAALAKAQYNVMKALDAARRHGEESGDRRNEQYFEQELAKLDQRIAKLSDADARKFVKAIRAEENKESIESQAQESGGTALNVAEGESARSGDEYSDAARLGRITERDDAAEVGTRKPTGSIGAGGGGRVGRRYFRVEGEKDGKVLVQMLNEKGKPQGDPMPMSREQWEMLAKADLDKAENTDLDPARPQKGDMIRMSREGQTETPEERDARFAADENYQKWLKSRKANDAEPLRERYEGEQAEAFGGVWRNVISGVKGVKYHNEDYKGTEDGREKVRHLRTEDGRVVGTWNRKTGDLDLYRGASIKTLNHEFGHAIRQYAEQEAARGNRALFDKIEKCIDEAERDVPEFVKDIRRRYKQGANESDADYENRIRDEIWGAIREGRNSEVLKNAIKTLQGRAWYNRAWDAIKTAWKGILARMGFNRADLAGIDKMTPEQFNDFLDRTMAEGKTLGRLEQGEGEGQRAMLEPGTFQKISNAIKRYKEQGVKFSPFTESIVSMLQRGGKKVIDLPGFQPTQLIIESPAFSGSIQGRYDLDHSALKHNWESGRAYSGYYTWPEFDRAFRDYNLKNIIKLPNKHAEQETWQWTVKYPKTDSHDAYTLTWKLVRNTNTGKMENLFTTREQKDYPPTKIQTPEGVHFDTITSRDVAETSSSGVAERSIAKPEGESQGGEENTRKSVSSAPAKGNPIDDVRPKGERLQEGAQDSDISIRNLQRDLGGVEDKQTESGHTDAKTTFNEDGTVKELGSTDVYSAKMRMNGHLQAGFNEIKSGQNTIDKTLADNGLTQAQFDKFLYASHVPERNQTIAERMAENANKAEWRKARAEAEKGNTAPLEALRRAVKVDTASKEYSGMSTDDANAYLDSPEVASKRAALESAANELYKMERKNLDRLLESGRISKEFYDLLTTRWKKYVPLRTDVEGKDGAAYNLSVGGFRQNEFLTAEGRKTEADSPYTFAMLQLQQGLRGSEVNTVNLTAANLVRKAEQQGYHIGDIIEGKESGRGKGWTFLFADGDKVEVGGDMKLAKNRKDIILFKENGELKAIRMVKGANGRGEAVADAIAGRNVRQWTKDLTLIPRFTRWLSAMRTQFSPEFIFSNALADHMESTQALIGRYGIKDGGKLAGQAIAWEVRNRKDLRQYIKTGNAGNGYVKEAIDAGVLIKGGVAAHGYAGELKDIQSSYDKFVRDAKGFGNMNAKEKAKFVWDGLANFISHTNEFIENSTRIGIYSALREHGVSKAEAVKFAREATVDFNRKGIYTPWVNGLFMFSNASIQGALRSVQAMTDANGKSLVGLLIGAGIAKAGLDYILGNDDDREKEGGRNARNLSEYDKKHKLGIPIPGTSYQVTALRMRGPYAAIPYLAQTFTNVALGETKESDAAKTVIRELTDQATDLLSGNGIMNGKGELDSSLILQSFAPTLADPIVQWTTGKDYKGDERKARAFDKTMPLSSNGKRNTPVPYKLLAQGINAIPGLSGGNENRKGRLDIAPEDLQLIVEFLAGGVGRDLGNVVSTVQNAKEIVTGGSPERTLSQTPLARTLVNEYPENTSRYFDALDAYERDKAEFKKTTDIERRREMKKEKPYLFTGKSLLDGQIDKVKELTHLERGEVKSGNKWVEPKTPRSEAQKEKYRELRLKLQATILRQLKA